jgi:hypothetical protein
LQSHCAQNEAFSYAALTSIPNEKVIIRSEHSAACHRFLGEQEAVNVVRNYERWNRFRHRLFAGFSADSSAGDIADRKTIAADPAILIPRR